MSPQKLSATKLTPNLLVSNVERSLAFYENVLGFSRGMTVPEQSPFVFASVASGPVEIFFNDRSTVTKENPQMGGLAFGGGNTMFIEVTGIDALHKAIKVTGQSDDAAGDAVVRVARVCDRGPGRVCDYVCGARWDTAERNALTLTGRPKGRPLRSPPEGGRHVRIKPKRVRRRGYSSPPRHRLC